MPELPEVETVRATVEPRVRGQKVRAVWSSGKPLRLARPVNLPGLRRVLVGGTVSAVSRRGKYLIIEIDGENAAFVHLGMTGRLTVAEPGAPQRPHTHIVVRFASGRELRFVDPRRFGCFAPWPRRGTPPELALLGEDPLSLRGDALYQMTRGSRTSVKAFLLDQRRLAGVGNIYACEALFVAGIHPARRAGTLSCDEASRLALGVTAVLQLGLGNRGTTFRDFIDADGRAGENLESLRVYMREGELCLNCSSGRIRRLVQNARSTFFCPECQRRKPR